jgi:hypothetical protein
MGLFVAFIAVFVKVINPALNYLCDKFDPIDDLQPVVGEEAKKSFDPSVTDILGYNRMDFAERKEEQPELYMGLTYILKQSCPRWMVKVCRHATRVAFGIFVWQFSDFVFANSLVVTQHP